MSKSQLLANMYLHKYKYYKSKYLYMKSVNETNDVSCKQRNVQNTQFDDMFGQDKHNGCQYADVLTSAYVGQESTVNYWQNIVDEDAENAINAYLDRTGMDKKTCDAKTFPSFMSFYNSEYAPCYNLPVNGIDVKMFERLLGITTDQVVNVVEASKLWLEKKLPNDERRANSNVTDTDTTGASSDTSESIDL